MDAQAMELFSRHRFLIRGLRVTPDVMGASHGFEVEGGRVHVRLPMAIEANNESRAERTSEVDMRWSLDGAPKTYAVHQVLVEVHQDLEVELDPDITLHPPNKTSMVPESVQSRLEGASKAHESIAFRSFEYWSSIVRWVVDDYRIGRPEIGGVDSGWGTYLHDCDTQKPVWVAVQTIRIQAFRALAKRDWDECGEHLSRLDLPPVHIQFLHEAEDRLGVGDYRRCIIDLCISCETFLRSAVINSLPRDLDQAFKREIERSPVHKFHGSYFPALLLDDARRHYELEFKKDLKALFEVRNALMHRGEDAVERDTCPHFVATVRGLFRMDGAYRA